MAPNMGWGCHSKSLGRSVKRMSNRSSSSRSASKSSGRVPPRSAFTSGRVSTPRGQGKGVCRATHFTNQHGSGMEVTEIRAVAQGFSPIVTRKESGRSSAALSSSPSDARWKRGPSEDEGQSVLCQRNWRVFVLSCCDVVILDGRPFRGGRLVYPRISSLRSRSSKLGTHHSFSHWCVPRARRLQPQDGARDCHHDVSCRGARSRRVRPVVWRAGIRLRASPRLYTFIPRPDSSLCGGRGIHVSDLALARAEDE